jgi:hypothetical protein
LDAATAAMVMGAIAAAWLLGRPRAADDALPLPEGKGRWGLRENLGLLITVAAVGLYAFAIHRLFNFWQRDFDWAAPLAVGSIALWSLGLALIDRRWRRPVQGSPVTLVEVAAVVAVMAFACFLRFYRLDYFPPVDGFVAIEEPQSGMGAWDILANGVRPWEFLLDRWMPVPFFKLLGPTITALRLPFVIVSCLTVLATYLLARQLVSPGAALFGTLLLAMARWHLNYARLGHAVFPTTLLVVVIWALCVRQYKRGGLALYPWIGFWTAYTLYAYAGYRATGLVVGAFLLTRLVVAARAWWRTAEVAQRLRARQQVVVQAIGLVIAAAALAGPCVVLVDRLRHNPMYFVEAYNRSYQNKQYYTDDWESWIRVRIQRQIDTLKMFNHLGDTEQAYNLPGEPMLDPVTGVLFAIAAFYCLFYWRYRLQGYFVLTFLFLLFAGAMLTQTLVICRLQGVVPPLFVLIAFAADRFGQVCTARFGSRIRPLLVVAAMVVAGLAFRLNYEAYFDRTMNSPVVRAVYRNFYTSGAMYYHSVPNNGYFLFVTDMHNFFEPSDYIWWIGKRVPGGVTADLWPLISGKGEEWSGREVHVLVQLPFEQQEILRLIRDYYPDAQCQFLKHPEGLPHLDQLACVIGPGQTARRPVTGIRARYFKGDETTPFLERDEPAISWALVPDACAYWGNRGQYTCRVEWEGSFEVAKGGQYEIRVDARHIQNLAVTLDGEPVEGVLTLSAGRHTLKASADYRETVDIGVRVFWKKAKAANWKLLRFDG